MKKLLIIALLCLSIAGIISVYNFGFHHGIICCDIALIEEGVQPASVIAINSKAIGLKEIVLRSEFEFLENLPLKKAEPLVHEFPSL